MSGEHSKTPWQDEPENWLSIYDVTGEWSSGLVGQVNGKRRPEADANRERIIACVNAFHSPDRHIPTEQVIEGLFWQIHDAIAAVNDSALSIGADSYRVGTEELERLLALLDNLKVQTEGDG